MSRLRTLGPHVALAAIGVLLGASGTALALSGQRTPMGPGGHGGPGSSSLTSRHEVYSPPGGDSGGSGGSGGGSNRGCVYLTNRDCVYPSTYSLGRAGARRLSVFVRLSCVGPSRCKVRLSLTIEEKLRGGRIRAIAAAAHAPAADGAGAENRAEAARRNHRHRRHRHHERSLRRKHRSRARLHTRIVTVANRTVTLGGSHPETYRLVLNATGRRLLRRFGVLRARLVSRAESGATKVGRAPVKVVTFRRRR